MALKGSMARFSAYTTRLVGKPHSLEHRVYIEEKGQVVSAFHDIPLYANKERTILNMIVEIPRWSNAKLEISKGEAFNPIKQDVKNGKLRSVKDIFPYKGYIWNYGAFPQTWEDPVHVHPETGARGDNDPLDVCEIGERIGFTGEVKQVKVLGIMALLDEGETDWKVIALDVRDPMADKVHDIEDVRHHYPGLLEATHDWFKIYKIPDGKPPNHFAFKGEAKNKSYATQIIQETEKAWQSLISGEVDKHRKKLPPSEIARYTLKTPSSPFHVTPDSDIYKTIPKGNGVSQDDHISKWFYVPRQKL
ncbi:Inorganic pyrophosphatase [Bifiguratus adelaidae]|uniref:Inorganic pyrophosphatase n=1 Tax=Bifiguratus adelaidae TaxID=1938954 RepID=A0A261XYI5_9FUNG|nr:Inorganic pyrophosphatase [Bifiguratus adelaidae]